MTNHSQQEQHGANDAVDEHGNDHEEGEEAGPPLVVDPHNQDDHQRYEHHYGEVDILSCHSPVGCNKGTQYSAVIISCSAPHTTASIVSQGVVSYVTMCCSRSIVGGAEPSAKQLTQQPHWQC